MLAQAMEVLELFDNTRRELGVADVAKLLGRSKSTVSGWMAAMNEVGLLDRAEGGGPYRVGIRLAGFGVLAQRSTSLQVVATPLLEQMTRRTRETTSLNVLIGSEVVNTAVVESPQPIHSAGGLGIPMPLHATAAGKILLAWRSAQDARHLLPFSLAQYTPATITDITLLQEELEKTRQQGYAIAHAELASDLFAVSAPIRDASGSVVGALSITAPLSRVPEERVQQLAQEVVEHTAAASQALGYRAAA